MTIWVMTQQPNIITTCFSVVKVKEKWCESKLGRDMNQSQHIGKLNLMGYKMRI